jgi:serine-type D-Ala-D-Ala carboxypeptidase (penicillin-binding protein 5/6)
VLVASGTRDGVTLISAVLGAPSEAARDQESLELLEYGFSLYQRKRPIREGEPLATATIAHQDETLELVAKDSIALTVRKGQKVTTEVEVPAEVEGPIERTEQLGEVIVRVDGDARGRSPVIASRAVPEATIADRVDSALPGPRVIVWVVVLVGLTLVAIIGLRLWLNRTGADRSRR